MFLSFFIFFCRLLSRRSGCCSLFFYPPLAWENGGRLCVGLFVSARRLSACWKLNSFLLKRTRQPKGKKRKEKKVVQSLATAFSLRVGSRFFWIWWAALALFMTFKRRKQLQHYDSAGTLASTSAATEFGVSWMALVFIDFCLWYGYSLLVGLLDNR